MLFFLQGKEIVHEDYYTRIESQEVSKQLRTEVKTTEEFNK